MVLKNIIGDSPVVTCWSIEQGLLHRHTLRAEVSVLYGFERLRIRWHRLSVASHYATDKRRERLHKR